MADEAARNPQASSGLKDGSVRSSSEGHSSEGHSSEGHSSEGHSSENSRTKKSASGFQLGMSTFDVKERQQFGRSIRLAMACIEGEPQLNFTSPKLPTDAVGIRERLGVLSQNITSQHADLLELLVRFDDVKGWEASGAKHCVAWMNLDLGIGRKLAWEYLKVGRELRDLPTTTALFRAGKLSWSKVRAIARVADKENEKLLCHAALDASVSDVLRLCRDYQWDKNNDGCKSDNERAVQQWQSRSLTWNRASNGSTCIQLTLPPESAQAFLNSVEHSLSRLQESAKEESATQIEETEQPEISLNARRADAALLMAEASLQADSRDIAAADRYQVIVSVQSDDLLEAGFSTVIDQPAISPKVSPSTHKAPVKRPSVRHAGPIARETARRIACDCSLTRNTTSNGEPVSIGRKSRLWLASMARAIKERDQHCQFYGCSQTANLQIHHIKHWADGGTTSIDNGVCLCQSCHTKVHEGGFKIQRVDASKQRLDQQFARQQQLKPSNTEPPADATTDAAADATEETAEETSVEQQLRNNRESFNQVRALLPTTHRFQIVDAQGDDIRDHVNRNEQSATIASDADSTRVDSIQMGSEHGRPTHERSIHVDFKKKDSTHVEFTSTDVIHTDFTYLGSVCPDSSTDIAMHPWFIAENMGAYHVRH